MKAQPVLRPKQLRAEMAHQTNRFNNGGRASLPGPRFFRSTLKTAFAAGFFLNSFAVTAQDFRINLEDTFKMALQNNEKIKLAELDYEIAKAEAEAASFDFDIHATLALPTSKEVTLSKYTYEDAEVTDKTVGISAGLKTKTRIGTELEAVLQSLQIQTTSSQIFLKTRSQGAALFKLSQPLLKGAGFAVNEATERKSKASLEKYKWKLRETIQEQWVKIGGFFWDLYGAAENLKIAKEMLKRSEEQLRSELAFFEAGRKSRLDYLKAKANGSLSRAKAILAEADYLEAEEKLAREILPLKESGIEFSITPVVDPDKTNSKTKTVFSNSTHPKLLRMGMEVSEAEVDLKKSDRNRLPQLDLSLEYLSTGLQASASSSLNQVVRQKVPSFTVGLNFSLPLDGYSSYGDTREKRAVHTSKTLTLEKEKISMESNRLTLQETLRQNEAVLNSIRSRLQLEKQKKEAKQALYRAGRLSWQEYLDSEKAYESLLKSVNQQTVSFQKTKLKLEELGAAAR